MIPPPAAISKKDLQADTAAKAPIVCSVHVQPQGRIGKTTQFLIDYHYWNGPPLVPLGRLP